MAKGSGNGKTPERVQELLGTAIKKGTVRKVASEIGLSSAAVHRYASGKGEPTTATLERLAGYFGVTVPWLRGETWTPTEKYEEFQNFLDHTARPLTDEEQALKDSPEYKKGLDALAELTDILGGPTKENLLKAMYIMMKGVDMQAGKE